MTIGHHFRAARKQMIARFLQGALPLPKVGDEGSFCESGHCSAEDHSPPPKWQKRSWKLVWHCHLLPRQMQRCTTFCEQVRWPMHGLGEVVHDLPLAMIPASRISWRSEEEWTWVLWVQTQHQDSLGLSRDLGHCIYVRFWAMPSRTQAAPSCSMNEPKDKWMQLAPHKPNSSGHPRCYLQSSKFGVHF